jgi:hypothetical protein
MRTACFLFCCVAVWSGLLASKQAGFDLSSDFSLVNNPDGVWTFGYSATKSLAPDQFRIDEYSATSDPVGFWHPASNKGPGPGYYPYVAYNTTDESRTTPAKGWAVRPHEIAMEASNVGQYALVRFTAPQADRYQISAHFEGIHFHLSTTDVHVMHNAESLFAEEIEGYGGDPAFHKIEGQHAEADYKGIVRLAKNDTITFAVGYGRNHTPFNDTTGLFARITSVSAESSTR